MRMRAVHLAMLPLVLGLALAVKLGAMALDLSDTGSVAGGLVLILGFGTLWFWLRHLERAPEVAPPPQAAPAPPAAIAAPPTSERRLHPRVRLDLPAELQWHHGPRHTVPLHDISRGGARLKLFQPEPQGRRGLLHLEGLALPVPFTIVDSRPESGLHLRFDLEGMGLDALERQLEELVRRQAEP